MNYIKNLIGENPFLVTVVAIVIILQLRVAIRTIGRIVELNNFFPDLSMFRVIRAVVPVDILKDDKAVNGLAANPGHRSSPRAETAGGQSEGAGEDADDEQTVETVDVHLVTLDSQDHPAMQSVIYRTNRYLCKNIGTSADFPLIKDICERRLDVLEAEIQNSLNTPLYLGLAGTFMGIIFGLWGIDLSSITGADGVIDLSAFQGLLGGVVVAMCASFFGLGLTIFTSTFLYRDAYSRAVSDKDVYFDFLQRELMPTLSTSMSSSLNALKSVLGHFVDKFGGNLDTYTSSIDTLNDNIATQHKVLKELNKLGLTNTASKMAETFRSLETASVSLDVFRQYQTNLNDTMRRVSDTVGEVNTVISRFDDFGRALKVVAENQTRTIALETEFKNAIEAHFPTGSVGREIWQKSFDELVGDAKEVTRQLNEQLAASTQHISNFVNGNSNFFSSFQQIQGVLAQLVSYSQLQAKCYQDLKDEIANIRKDNKDIQGENAELGKSILEAVKEMTSVARSIKG